MSAGAKRVTGMKEDDIGGSPQKIRNFEQNGELGVGILSNNADRRERNKNVDA